MIINKRAITMEMTQEEYNLIRNNLKYNCIKISKSVDFFSFPRNPFETEDSFVQERRLKSLRNCKIEFESAKKAYELFAGEEFLFDK